jgi:hypothetical protein
MTLVRLGSLGIASLAAALAVTATPAEATGPFGSAQYSTYRDCSAWAATDVCDGTLPGQQIVTGVYGGGLGVTGSANLDRANGSFAHSSVSFGALALPELRGETYAVGQDRMNINVYGFQSYTFTGPSGTAFSLTGDLHIADSSTDGGAGALPGGAIYSQYIAIWDPAILAGLTTPQELFTALFYADCSTAGVLGFGQTSGALPGGEQTFSVSTTECSTGSLQLTNGQQVLAVAGMQLPANRGGFVDSTHTFKTRLDDALPAEVRATLEANLIPAGVPEPASWALMIGGFGLVGSALRRRARQAVFA